MWHPRVCVARRGRSDAEGCEKEAEARLVQRMHDGRIKGFVWCMPALHIN